MLRVKQFSARCDLLGGYCEHREVAENVNKVQSAANVTTSSADLVSCENGGGFHSSES